MGDKMRELKIYLRTVESYLIKIIEIFSKTLLVIFTSKIDISK